MKRRRFLLVVAQQGFTMIELLMVMAILGVLAGMIVVNFPAAQGRARDAQRKSDIKQYQTSLESYANKNDGLFPIKTTAVEISTICASLGLSGAACPSGTPAYRYITDASGIEYVSWAELEQKDKLKRTQYFVVCSNGTTDVEITEPSTATCPL